VILATLPTAEVPVYPILSNPTCASNTMRRNLDMGKQQLLCCQLPCPDLRCLLQRRLWSVWQYDCPGHWAVRPFKCKMVRPFPSISFLIASQNSWLGAGTFCTAGPCVAVVGACCPHDPGVNPFQDTEAACTSSGIAPPPNSQVAIGSVPTLLTPSATSSKVRTSN
jgi:hypothetical protein